MLKIKRMCEKVLKSKEVYKMGDISIVPLVKNNVESYAADIATFCNSNLHSSYARFSEDALLATEKRLKDGRIISIDELWNGTSFVLFNKDNQIVGVSLSRRECIKNEIEVFDFTGRGTNTILVMDESLRGTPASILMLVCYVESLYQKGCTSVFGSTYMKNTQADSLFKKFCTTRVEDGEWLRYTLDIDAARQYYLRLLQRIGQEDIIKFIGKIAHEN